MAEWKLTVEKGGCMDYHVRATCSKCGWEHFSKDGIGNYKYVFSAFIRGPEKEAKKFALSQAENIQKFPYCPMCGEKMETETEWLNDESKTILEAVELCTMGYCSEDCPYIKGDDATRDECRAELLLRIAEALKCQ